MGVCLLTLSKPSYSSKFYLKIKSGAARGCLVRGGEMLQCCAACATSPEKGRSAGGELSFPKQVYLWGRVKSMDANGQIRSEMCA